MNSRNQSGIELLKAQSNPSSYNITPVNTNQIRNVAHDLDGVLDESIEVLNVQIERSPLDRPNTAQEDNKKNKSYNAKMGKQKRVMSGLQSKSAKKVIGDSKSVNTLGQTELLKEFVGMAVGQDEEDPIGSDFNENIPARVKANTKVGGQSTNSTSQELKTVKLIAPKTKDVIDLELGTRKNSVNGSTKSGGLNVSNKIQHEKSALGNSEQKVSKVVTVLQNSLYQPYLVDEKKFDVKEIEGIINKELLSEFKKKLKYKINVKKRQINKILIDFGPYPLQKNWLVDIREDEEEELLDGPRQQIRESKKVYLPPDEDNYQQHGVKNLVLKYEDGEHTFKVNKELHINSAFCRNNMIDQEDMEHFIG